MTERWVTWYSLKSGNKTTRAHLVEATMGQRTECGWPIPALHNVVNEAGPQTPKCRSCLKASIPGETS